MDMLDEVSSLIIGDGSPVEVEITGERRLVVEEMCQNICSNPRQQGDRTDDEVYDCVCFGKAIEFGMERNGFTRTEPSGGGPIRPDRPEEWASDLLHPGLDVRVQVKSFGDRTFFSVDPRVRREIFKNRDHYQFIATGLAKVIEPGKKYLVTPLQVIRTEGFYKYLTSSDRIGEWYYDHFKSAESGDCKFNTNSMEIRR